MEVKPKETDFKIADDKGDVLAQELLSAIRMMESRGTGTSHKQYRW
ncbi:MAG: hypothetical protein LBV04_10285 [Deferribacteraceae bacterium]|jgi:hypothetical protein|nr:hypothetical protein [Deferribacteraceae bacterium]